MLPWSAFSPTIQHHRPPERYPGLQHEETLPLLSLGLSTEMGSHPTAANLLIISTGYFILRAGEKKHADLQYSDLASEQP